MAKISAKILFKDETELDVRGNLVSASIGCLDRGDMTDVVEYSVYQNKGDISFVDTEKKFKSAIENNLVIDCEVEIFISSNYGEKRKKVATFKVADFEYDKETLVAKIELNDIIGGNQDASEVSLKHFESLSLYEVAAKIFGSNFVVDNLTKSVWESITVYCPYLDSSSRWEFMRKLCEASMCRCFSSKDGYRQFAFPLKKAERKILIRPKNIYKVNQTARNEKNAILGATISALKRIKKQNLPVGEKKYKKIIETYFEGEDICTGTHAVYDVDSGGVSCDVDWSGQFPKINASYTINSDGIIHSLSQKSGIIKAQTITGTSVGNKTFPIEVLEKKKTTLDTSDVEWSISDDRKSAYIKTSYFEVFNSSQAVYIVQDIYCDIYGDSFVDKGDAQYTYGSGLITQLPSNELIQDAGRWGDMNIAQKILQITEEAYKKGAECVEFECDFGDYQFEDGTLAYSQSLSDEELIGFNKYDVVTPYIVRNGVEQPYSTDANGNPKSFTIIGIKYNYGGVLRQNLVLQEYTPIEI